MLWFRSIKKFKLEVYNKKLQQSIASAYNNDALFYLFLMPKEDQLRLFRKFFRDNIELLQFCIENRFINREWIPFYEWCERDSIMKTWKHDFLFRSISKKYYRLLLKLGSTWAAETGEFEDNAFREENLPRYEYIWATPYLDKAWESASFFLEHEGCSIIVLYKSKYFYQKQIPSNANHVWVKVDKNMDYRDTIEAIVRIRFC